jgi:hypothetical protein
MIAWLLALPILAAVAGFFVRLAAREYATPDPVWRTLGEEQTRVRMHGPRRTWHRPAEPNNVKDGVSEQRPENHKVELPEISGADLLAREDAKAAKDLWVDCNYCWVVVCKNHRFHHCPNAFNVHRIPLGETDAFASRPPIEKPFSAPCDECGKEYSYKPSEVLRYEMEVAPSFLPHPLFRDSI